MNYQFINIERDGPITLVTINRPQAMNALHRAAHDEMTTAFNDFAADPEQWVGILTGVGDRAFSAGNDLKATAAGQGFSMPERGFGGITSRFDIDKPIIAAVNGVAVGGGFEMALACDIIIASEKASFGLPEPRVGLAALAGGLHRLPRAIGLSRAMALVLTAELVSAGRAKELGLVYEVVEAAQLLASAKELARRICQLGPLAVRASKQTVLKGLQEPTLAEAILRQWNYPAVERMLASEDAQEGPRAFADKRAPSWKGA